MEGRKWFAFFSADSFQHRIGPVGMDVLCKELNELLASDHIRPEVGSSSCKIHILLNSYESCQSQTTLGIRPLGYHNLHTMVRQPIKDFSGGMVLNSRLGMNLAASRRVFFASLGILVCLTLSADMSARAVPVPPANALICSVSHVRITGIAHGIAIIIGSTILFLIYAHAMNKSIFIICLGKFDNWMLCIYCLTLICAHCYGKIACVGLYEAFGVVLHQAGWMYAAFFGCVLDSIRLINHGRKKCLYVALASILAFTVAYVPLQSDDHWPVSEVSIMGGVRLAPRHTALVGLKVMLVFVSKSAILSIFYGYELVHVKARYIPQPHLSSSEVELGRLWGENSSSMPSITSDTLIEFQNLPRRTSMYSEETPH